MNQLETIKNLQFLFHQQFYHSEKTSLQFGAKEPFYQAPSDDNHAIIFTRELYFSSALHEIAHWCLAGKNRRKLDDFGYWYIPDGRNKAQQLEFERVEVKPQAIECLFSWASQHSFYFSADNLNEKNSISFAFKKAIKHQIKEYSKKGLPLRAAIFFEYLLKTFNKKKNKPYNELLVHESLFFDINEHKKSFYKGRHNDV
jgi:elongation factor P hydroxylase